MSFVARLARFYAGLRRFIQIDSNKLALSTRKHGKRAGFTGSNTVWPPRAAKLYSIEVPSKRAPDASPGSVLTLLGTPLSTYSPRKTAARGLSQRGNARRRGAGSTASVGEPDADVGVAEAGVSGPLRANSVRAPRFSVRAAATRQYWQVIIIRDLRRRPVP